MGLPKCFCACYCFCFLLRSRSFQLSESVSQAVFKRVELSEESKTGWSEKETLLLLEAVMHYGDDWKKVAQDVCYW